MPLIDVYEKHQTEKKSKLSDTLSHNHTSQINTNESVRKDQTTTTTHTSVLFDQSFLPQIKGLELLKDGTYTIDLEKTISDMLVVIKNMESQLERVLDVNVQYEKELDFSKQLISKLKSEKASLLDTMALMEKQMPTKRELQIEIDHMIEEKSSAHNRIRDMMKSREQMSEEITKLNDYIRTFDEEKMDARMEIGYLEVQIKALHAKNRKYAHEINILKGERVSFLEKIKSLYTELQYAYSQQFKKDLENSEKPKKPTHIFKDASTIQPIKEESNIQMHAKPETNSGKDSNPMTKTESEVRIRKTFSSNSINNNP
nr:magnetosome protein Mad25-2 [Desulfobacteraceae bacterium]